MIRNLIFLIFIFTLGCRPNVEQAKNLLNQNNENSQSNTRITTVENSQKLIFNNLSISKNKILSGDSTDISFDVSNAKVVTLKADNINLLNLKTIKLNPVASTEYTIVASNDSEKIEKKFLIEVGELPKLKSFSIVSHIKKGDVATLMLEAQNFKKIILNPGGINLTAKSFYFLSPSDTTEYSITASNDFGEFNQKFTLNVINLKNDINLIDKCHNTNIVINYTNTKSVASFGAIPNTNLDQTVAIQKALDSLVAGDRLVFEPGVYLHNASLKINKSYVVIEGNNTELRGTNSLDQAFWIRYSDVTVRNFIITNFTEGRRSEPWSSGISSYAWNSGKNILKNINIINNTLVPIVGLGYNYEMGSGIFVYNTQNYNVIGNLVLRSYADGIHNTHASINGQILNNTVLETGDDGIAVVSYLDKTWRTQMATDPNFLSNNYDSTININILISNNRVSGQYWGRGITVVGGKDITIENNDVSKIGMAAGIYISREQSYDTPGANNILIRNNTVSDIQNIPSAFVPQGPAYEALRAKIATSRTGQGAIEIYSQITNTDFGYAGSMKALTIDNVQIENNKVANTYKNGIRVGVNGNHHQALNFIDNKVDNAGTVGGQFYFNTASFDKNPYCSNNLIDGANFSSAFCTNTATKNVTTGFTCN